MKTSQYGWVVLSAAIAGFYCETGVAQRSNGIEPNALIERIVTVDRRQKSEIRDVVFDAEYIEGETDGDGNFREKTRFIKKVYVKYINDTALYHEEYLEYYKDGRLQPDRDRDKEAADRTEKKMKRRSKDVSYSMLRPFYPERRELYDLAYQGVADDAIENHVCHHFRVTAKEATDTLINGDYYFDAESFHLVRIDFSPAKLTASPLFKLKDLSMSIIYGPTGGDYWLPRQFDVRGRGKAMFFIGVKFAGTEYYRNPIINAGIADSLFEVNNGQ